MCYGLHHFWDCLDSSSLAWPYCASLSACSSSLWQQGSYLHSSKFDFMNAPNTLNWIVIKFVKKIRSDLLTTSYVLTSQQEACIFTKPLGLEYFVSSDPSWVLWTSMLQLEGEYYIIYLLLFPCIHLFSSIYSLYSFYV